MKLNYVIHFKLKKVPIVQNGIGTKHLKRKHVRNNSRKLSITYLYFINT